MTTGERIKQRRLELGMTQTELAEKTGYSDKSSIAVIESGKNNLRQSKIQAFADALDCDPLWLIGLDEQEPTEPPDYYLNADSRAAAEFLHHNPKYKVLFDAARNVSEKDIDFVKQMIDRVTGNE